MHRTETTETTPVAEATKAAATGKPAGKTVLSDVSQLKRLGVDIGPGVLIDVADDGVDRWMQIGENSVDFTGTTRPTPP